MMDVLLTLAGDGGIVTVGEGVCGDDDLVGDGVGGPGRVSAEERRLVAEDGT